MFVGAVASYVNVIDGLIPTLPPESVDVAVTVYDRPLANFDDDNANDHEPAPLVANATGDCVVVKSVPL